MPEAGSGQISESSTSAWIIGANDDGSDEELVSPSKYRKNLGLGSAASEVDRVPITALTTPNTTRSKSAATTNEFFELDAGFGNWPISARRIGISLVQLRVRTSILRVDSGTDSNT